MKFSCVPYENYVHLGFVKKVELYQLILQAAYALLQEFPIPESLGISEGDLDSYYDVIRQDHPELWFLVSITANKLTKDDIVTVVGIKYGLVINYTKGVEMDVSKIVEVHNAL